MFSESNTSVQFYPEATEMEYMCEGDAREVWDAEHAPPVHQLDQVEMAKSDQKARVFEMTNQLVDPAPKARPRKKAPPPPPPPIVAQSNHVICDFTPPPGYRVSNLRKTFITPF